MKIWNFYQINEMAKYVDIKSKQSPAEAQNLEERKNYNFQQVYQKGWKTIRHIIRDNPVAADLYCYLASQVDNELATVVVTQDTLAEELQCSKRSISRYSLYLEQIGVIVRIKLTGQVYAYCLDYHHVWRSWDSNKKYAVFNASVIADKQLNKSIEKKLLRLMTYKNNPITLRQKKLISKNIDAKLNQRYFDYLEEIDKLEDEMENETRKDVKLV